MAVSKLGELLKLDYSQKGNIWLESQVMLRRTIGILGMLLPFLLFLFLLLFTGFSGILESMSHYYYTRANSVLIITISLLAIFLLLYKGESEVDFYISALAGIFALCVLLFPTTNITTCCDTEKTYSIAHLRETAGSGTRVIFHYTLAAIFLLCLAYMSLFLFTRSAHKPKNRTPNKRRRNRIYRVCGVIMLLAVATIFLGFINVIPGDFYDNYHLTFWMEAVAVESFGVSWLVKSEAILKD